MLKIHLPGMLVVMLAASTLAACSPAFNWREYRSPDASFHVLFPAKPATFSRTVDLDGLTVRMTMTAAEVDGATFAVGSADLPDASRAAAALLAMKTALLRNIGAAAKSEQQAVASATTTGTARQQSSIDVDASGASPTGVPLQLSGRFLARGQHVYQVIVMNKGAPVAREQIDMFLGAFSLD